MEVRQRQLVNGHIQDSRDAKLVRSETASLTSKHLAMLSWAISHMSKFNSSTEDVPRRRRQQAGRWPETIGRPMKFLMTRPQFSPQFPEFSQKNKLKIHSRLSMAAPVSLLFHPRWLKSLPFDIRSRSFSRGLARMCFAAALARHSLLHTAL